VCACVHVCSISRLTCVCVCVNVYVCVRVSKWVGILCVFFYAF